MTKILIALGAAVTPDAPELDGLKAAGYEIQLGKSSPTLPVGDVIEYLQGCAAVAAGGDPAWRGIAVAATAAGAGSPAHGRRDDARDAVQHRTPLV